ncbi:helicase-exonuclease AddAB subunit AddA [Bacillus marasmi]|uniref:helicase-exonuclease AddAB subunit AddA n=1 Tax=Bacillus marasmi TaxID=1926279 RepID=UPI0011CBA4B2|nr:helicase-exonuclease AddAB subunit AddA [Bacillus marasmi]
MYQLAQSIIPPKPSDVTWTDEQWKAIYAKNQDILVAAAAGSGKTAVLVERMIQKIIASDDPINVDELLVVTFTNASAAEMRTRIGEALEKAIQADPTSIHLRKQLTLLNRAAISTLHSFCLEVIRKYYYLIDLDPSFRIANETEVQLLRDEVMDELFENEYGKNDNEPFFALVDAFTNDRSDDALQAIIGDVFNFSVSNPAPDLYLKSMIAMYEVDEATTSIEKLPFAELILEDIELQLEGAKGLLMQGLQLTKEPGGPAPRAENFIGDIEYVDALIAAKNESWDALYSLFQKIAFARAKTCKGDEYDPELIEKAQELRKKAKKILTDIQTEFFMRKPQSFLKDMIEMKQYVETIVGLVQEFTERFLALKREKGLVDFSDLEHYCLEILTEELQEDGTRQPSAAALFYQNRFKEVLVDEYQDTNMVQEAILQLVKSGNEECGNLFMVGDVKQSIYRFRLAEPNLFLGKYRRFTVGGDESGLRIDLAQNFRSRKEVLDGTNFIFKQIMGVRVGEIEYDDAAQLKLGASYPLDDSFPVELILIEQSEKQGSSAQDENTEDQEDTAGDEAVFDMAELEQSQLEARVMAKKIREMIEERKTVYNPKTKQSNPVKYRDIVILLRSFGWATQIIEEFKQQGIPVYANLSSGYFEATEVSIMLSLLKVIDNPYQDIPLASVLRSPLVGLSEAELAQIRIAKKNGAYYEALVEFSEQTPSLFVAELYEKVRLFLEQLADWRTRARQGALSQFIWQLLKETKFYDFVGGMPGGKQRQANLRALFDRARSYEATSFRGLFRFLRFIERMRERGDDLGTARALGEQEDVVRIMTIHSSKGLEFPVVFIAGTNRNFNKKDSQKPYMLDKEFGFAAKYIDPEKRIAYSSLPQLAFKRKLKREMLAEEMRVFYVALTRAKEKLFLLGSVKKLPKLLDKWGSTGAQNDWLLPDYHRATASTYLDWIGPALVRHQDFVATLGNSGSIAPGLIPDEVTWHSSSWKIITMKAEDVAKFEVDQAEVESNLLNYVKDGKVVPVSTDAATIIGEKLSWKYPFSEAAMHRAKQSVSEMKRQLELSDAESGSDLKRKFTKPLFKRPRFMQEKALTPAERGTAMHMVMQQIDLTRSINEVYLENLLDELLEKELLTVEQKEAIDLEQINAFFDTEIGKRMLRAKSVRRETPFSVSLPASEVYIAWQGDDESVLVQGIIDCLFEDEYGQTILLDYKTDSITARFKGGFAEGEPILRERYQLQLQLYERAIESILQKQIDEKYLFFFDGGHVVKM